MKVQEFVGLLGAEFYTGVPDSLLRPLGDYLMDTYGTDPHHHVIAVNEGNAAALAAGYHLSTGRCPVVYMQNSGEGNALNPAVSLLHEKVYAIPVIFVIGWRGEPGEKDEPQHAFQGEITTRLLEVMDIPFFVVGEDTSAETMQETMAAFQPLLAAGRDVAFVVRQGALTYEKKRAYQNPYPLTREEILQAILTISGDAPIVSTTGKASRELFELRESMGMGHERDFLTVGSMGHSSSIALSISIAKPKQTVWAVDGDGAALMHLGAMAVIGQAKPQNFIHVVVNNEAHESVGGLPTGGTHADLMAIARACGYDQAACVTERESLKKTLSTYAAGSGLRFLEVKCAIGARSDLGRPTTTPRENKAAFMAYLAEKNKI